MATLNQQFEEKVRPCIDLIDRIRSLNVEEHFELPAIAVIGDQSSGKSSVLEALSGVALPRGSGIVTRCPLELRMKRKNEGEGWSGWIIYRNYEADIEDSEAESILTEDSETVAIAIVDPEDVEEMIREAQDKLAGDGLGISNDLISMEITSSDAPDLMLIDLPGISRVALQGQDENIGDQIKRLIHKYISRRETIILVVVPCNVDIATTEALKMAREVDPDGERTLGILTKPDLVDEGIEEKVVDIVHNEIIPLKMGYMIVRCRGQQEITEKVSLTEALEREKAFFRDHAHFQILCDEGHATIPKLAESLALKLSHHIKRSLPQLEEQIEEKIEQTQAELKTYGSVPPSDEAGRLVFLSDKVTAFTQDAVSLTTGEEPKCEDKLNVFSTLRREFEKWNAHLDHAGEKFNKRIEKEVENYEEKYRGRELPGFINYKTFEVMVKERIKQLEEPAVKRLKEIGDAVRKAFIQLANSSFSGFINLKNRATARIETIMRDTESAAESMLRTQFKMELIVSSQDRINSSSLSDRKREEDEDKRKGTDSHKGRSIVYNMDNHATLQELMLHIKSYYQIATQHLAYQIPLVIRYHMLQQSVVQLQREMLQMLQDKRDMNTLLKEELTFGRRRVALQSRLDRLMQARAHLVEF